MTELLTGTVAFLFTDIEGSTQLLHELGDDYAVLLRDHHALLTEAVEAHGGQIVDTQGDSFFCVFPRVKDAVAATADAQRKLAEHEWPQGAQVRVRMGIHAAEPELEDGRYVGLGVHRAARVGSAAHGGQVLLSNAAAGMLGDSKLVLRDPRRARAQGLRPPGAALPASGRRPAGQVSSCAHWPAETRAEAPPRSRRAADRRRCGRPAAHPQRRLEHGQSRADLARRHRPKTNKVVDAIELGFKSNLIAAGEGYIWVADPDTSTLVKIDPHSRRIVQRTGLESDLIPTSIAAGGGFVWIAAGQGKRLILLRVYPAGGGLDATITLGPSGAPQLSPEGYLVTAGKSVWVLEPQLNRVSRVDSAREVPRVLGEGIAGAVRGIAVGEGAVWTAGPNTVTRIDARTGQATSTAPLGGEVAGYPSPNAVATGGGAVWFAGPGVVWRVDANILQPRSTVPIGAGYLALSSGAGGIWVAAAEGTVTHIDPTAGKAVATVNVGQPLGGIVAAYGKVWATPLT